ncbi:MAG: 4-hydroxy-3-methylbut-2-enyl diphosphate reductase [Lentisphaerae bacterium]|nr:4-hydroxy-3-methylbut-2-enyl diphosphate reductase [Lentisphaerota bacterium]
MSNRRRSDPPRQATAPCLKCSKYVGFCFGVQRAIKLAREAAGRHSAAIRTLGPIIHNPQVIAELRREGIRAVNRFTNLKPGEVLIIRSHGIPRPVEDRMHARGLLVIDATCPFVKKAQNLVGQLAREGCGSILIVGEPHHPEVEGLISYGPPGQVHVVQSVGDLKPLKLAGQVGLVAQTTQSPAACRRILASLRRRKGITVRVHDTICRETNRRQADAVRLARQSDAILVVGGKNSANTARLHSRCQAVNPRAYHIEQADELTPEMLRGVGTLGLVSGASTPASIVREIARKAEVLCAGL